MAHFRPSRSLSHRLRRVAAMARARTIYRCSECGAAEPKWAGRCSALRGVGLPRGGAGRARGGAGGGGRTRRPRCPSRSPRSTPRPGPRAPPTSASSTGCSRAGSCPGSVTVLGGEPGIGKSTLLLQALAGLAKAGPALPLRHRRGVGPAGAPPGRAAGCAAAAPVARVRHRAAARARPHRVGRARRRGRRLDPDRVRPRRCRSAPGSVAQVRECAHRLVRASKERAMSVGARRPRHQGRRRWRARGCSSTSSTPCCPSRASATTRCACCAP